MKKPNYELKAQVISNGLVDIQKKVSLTFFKCNQEVNALNETGEIIEAWKPMTSETAEYYSLYYKTNYPEEWKEAERVNNASYHRTKRLKTKIENMISSGSCIFLTLTFTNDVLDSTSELTRKRYVARFLKSVATFYIANIDYGKKKQREHYHAIVNCDMVNHELWKYGNIDFERVRVEQEDSPVKIAKYINKLTNHAIKETTQQSRIIYSRL